MENVEQWMVFAVFFENAMKAKGMNKSELAYVTGINKSTIKRFFDLDFCLNFAAVLEIIHALDLNLFFESQDKSGEIDKWFEDAMEKLGRRPGKLPKN